jgi:hypothetical protein
MPASWWLSGSSTSSRKVPLYGFQGHLAHLVLSIQYTDLQMPHRRNAAEAARFSLTIDISSSTPAAAAVAAAVAAAAAAAAG